MNKSKHLLLVKLGQFIRKKRVEKMLTGGELGQLLNVSQQQISRYENGKTGISIEMLDFILFVLGASWEDFYRDVLGNYKSDMNEEFHFFN